MKQNKIKLYAKALAEVLLKKGVDEKKIIKNFADILVKSGNERKAKEVLSIAQDIILYKRGNKKIILETARKMTQDQKKNFDNFIKNGDVVNEKINPDLIAGVKIIINNEKQFDSSMKSKLQKIL